MEVTKHNHRHNWVHGRGTYMMPIYVTKILTYLLSYSIYNTFIA